MSALSSSLGFLLASYRLEYGLRQPALAKRIGVTTRTLSRWEHSDSFPAAGFHARILAALSNAGPDTQAAVKAALGPQPGDTAAHLGQAIAAAAVNLGVAPPALRAALRRVVGQAIGFGLSLESLRALL